MVRMVQATHAEWIALESDDGVPTEQLTRKSKRLACDRSLLTCLADRWRPETHTFHFPWGEMAPTLQDVSYLLGLPLAGEAIGPLHVSFEWCNDMHISTRLGPMQLLYPMTAMVYVTSFWTNFR